jgi:single-strand DNA-binding protein
MFDTMITVVGNLVDDPKLRSTTTGTPVASFRIASTSRRFDQASGRHVDGNRLFLTVTCWQEMAANVASSLRKGQPVLVYGRLLSREYTKDEQVRVTFEMTAEAVGPNLARGRAEFTRSTATRALTSVAADANGMPPDLTEEFLAAVVRGETLVPVGV